MEGEAGLFSESYWLVFEVGKLGSYPRGEAMVWVVSRPPKGFWTPTDLLTVSPRQELLLAFNTPAQLTTDPFGQQKMSPEISLVRCVAISKSQVVSLGPMGIRLRGRNVDMTL